MNRLFVTLIIMLGILVTEARADGFSVTNTDGVTIYYGYTNNGLELEVARIEPKNVGSVVIPKEVTYMNRTRKVTKIGECAFQNCSSLTSISMPDCITIIGYSAFQGCSNLSNISIPQNVTEIGEKAFSSCISLTSILIPDNVSNVEVSTFEGCTKLSSVIIGESIKNIGRSAFLGCTALMSLSIGENVEYIGESAFWDCKSLVSLIIPNKVKKIDYKAFGYCENVKKLTLGASLEKIESRAFAGITLETIISYIQNPMYIVGKNHPNDRTFSENTFNNATLYVPVGTLEKYKNTGGWSDFLFIVEGDGSGDTPSVTKCAKPQISYLNGKLSYSCETEDVSFQSNITNTDIRTYNTNEIILGVTYNISVYATKAGYENSDVATATLCWVDVEPKTEGIENRVVQVLANAILIQTGDGRITVNGADDGSHICVYNTNGVLSGTAISHNGSAVINTNFHVGSVAIVKIGDKSVKIVLK